MDENPYQSPTWEDDGRYEPTTAVAAEKDRQPRGAWWWKDVLVVRRKDYVLPPFCAKSNESRGLGSCVVTAVRPWGIAVLFVAFLVPGVGLPLALAILGSMKTLGLAADVWLPLRGRTMAVCGLLELLNVGLVLSGNLLGVIGFFCENRALMLSGLILPLLGFGVFWFADRWYLRTVLLDADHLAVHGLHPDYLARLPEWEPAKPLGSGQREAP